MSMLASLRGSHANNLTWASFQHDMSIFSQCRALNRVRVCGSRMNGVMEIKIVHYDDQKAEVRHWGRKARDYM